MTEKTVPTLYVDNNMAARAKSVAADVLQRLSTFRLKKGRYIAGTLTSNPEEIAPSTDLQELVSDVQMNCEVCAIGACLISKARLFDNVPALKLLHEYDTVPGALTSGTRINVDRKAIEHHLDDVFTPLQLSMIESAFEMSIMGEDLVPEPQWDYLRGASMFGQRYDENPYGRVAAVMQNIIDNDGVFVVKPVADDDYDEEVYEDEDDEEEDEDDEEEDEDDEAVA
jgi:hypothetical protein